MLLQMNLAPIPSHIFGETLTNGTLTETFNHTMSFDPLSSLEWQRFVAANGTGYTSVGPYNVGDFTSGEFWSYDANPDYWFPNEWDATTLGAQTPLAGATDYETEYGVDYTKWIMGINGWGYENYPQDAYYWNGANFGLAANTKPTSQGLETITYTVINDVNTQLIKFESGEIDQFGSSALGAEVVNAHETSDDFVVKDFIPNSGARMLFFNTDNPHLKKFNVRLAITKAMDREKLVAIHDGLGQAWWNLAYPNKQTGTFVWDEVQNPIPFSYEEARDLMRAEGYTARDSNDDISTADIPNVNEAVGLLGAIGSEMYLLFAAFSMVSVVFIRKRKY
jgi:ABC-type transport system substrate-binding protein